MILKVVLSGLSVAAVICVFIAILYWAAPP